jgi:hypothetical protein
MRSTFLSPVPTPDGVYRLIFRQGEHGWSESDLGEIQIKRGELNQFILDQGINLDWPDWVKQAPYYLKITSSDGRKMRFNKKSPIVLAPGKYRLAWRLIEHGGSEVDWGEIEVTETGFVDLKLNTGITFISNDEAKHTLYAVNLATKKESNITNSWGPMALPVGKFRIDIKPERGERFTIVEEIDIAPNDFIELEM